MKWIRTEYGIFHKVDNESKEWYVLESGYSLRKEDVKVANTPKELIQFGDLIKYKGDEILLYYTGNDYIKYLEEWGNEINEIWTKTSEDTYTRQWQAE